jgi:hypothetical protein
MFTKDELRKFRVDFDKAVQELGKQYNIQIQLGNISFDNTQFHTKMSCTRLNTNGKLEIDTGLFERYKKIYGLNANIGDSYFHNGITLTIEGIDSKKPKYPVMLVGNNGKKYKATVESVNMFLEKK